MRPVNLIPPEDRRGSRALRAGAVSYVVLGAFGAVLVAVLALVLTQNSITKHENEIAELEVARDAASAPPLPSPRTPSSHRSSSSARRRSRALRRAGSTGSGCCASSRS